MVANTSVKLKLLEIWKIELHALVSIKCTCIDRHVIAAYYLTQ